jgi:RHS repeat-associated protein
MKKIFLVIVLTIFLGFSSEAQTSFTRPTPSAASMMNFTDVPVNLYSGVPNINIPLYSFPTRSKDIEANMFLAYHPNGVSQHDKVSDVGLGWSLFTGGIISKNVVDAPDELSALLYEVTDNVFDDIYTYNFFGNSGRFIIKKDSITDEYFAQKMDNSTVKIELAFSSGTQNVESFTIYDDKGYIFVFNVYDTIVKRFLKYNDYPHFNTGYSYISYRPSYYLTEVIDNNRKRLLNYEYSTTTVPYEPNPTIFEFTNDYRKLQTMTAEGIGKATFSYSYDSDLEVSELDPFELQDITIETLGDEVVKKFEFNYSGERRQLTAVREFDKSLNESLDYNLTYNNSAYGLPFADPSEYVVGTDMYGYVNRTFKCETFDQRPLLEVTPEMVAVGSLQKIQLPTGGSILYEFEPSTFGQGSNITNQTAQDYYYQHNEHDNIEKQLYDHTSFDTSVNDEWEFTVSGTETKKLYFKFGEDNFVEGSGYVGTGPPYTIVYKLFSGSTEVFDFSNIGLEDYNCLGRLVELAPGTYRIEINLESGLSATGEISITEKIRKPNPKLWEYGAGLRIKRIAYFTENVDSDYLNNPLSYQQPAKETNFRYNFFGNPNTSSGVIGFSFPVDLDLTKYGSVQMCYANVTAYDTGDNGYTRYTYKLPGDVIAGDYSDYEACREGLLSRREIFNNQDEIVVEVENTFDFTTIGSEVFPVYPTNNSSINSFAMLSWVKLSNTITSTYSQEGSNGIVEVSKSFTYNDENRRVASESSINSVGENLSIEYIYHEGNSIHSKNRISELEEAKTYRGSDLIASAKTIYSNGFEDNVAYLPQQTQVAKASEAFDDKLTVLQYDEFGNPIEVYSSNGITTCYIWGYNKTQPIAKIDNVTYDDIAVDAANLQTISNYTDPNDEGILIEALAIFRNSSIFENGMMTSYTYKPLLGISSITDVRGRRTTYEYDDFGRLYLVRDQENNIISQNTYNFQPNFTRTTTFREPTSDPTNSPEITQAFLQTTYRDGLGRISQQNAWKASPDGKDIITPVSYDELGRQIKSYLPYVSPGDRGDFDSDWLTNQPDFYTNTYAVSTSYPFSEKKFEHSPLNRPLEQSAPGETWRLREEDNADHIIRYGYDCNTTDEVRYFKANLDLNYNPTFEDIGYYERDRLFKTILRNENWQESQTDNENITEEFNDKEGRLILKRTYAKSEIDGQNTYATHDTYYIYDKFGNLTYVLPPNIDVSQTVTQTEVGRAAYIYQFDHKNRMVLKKIPGRTWEFLVYDKYDRIAATGPTKSPFGENAEGWLFSKYDQFGRIAYTGWYAGDVRSEFEELQEDYDSATIVNETLLGSDVDEITNVWSSDALPVSGYKLLTINYYDNYEFNDAPESIPSSIYEDEPTASLKGLATGSWVRALTSPNDQYGETSYTLYSKRAIPLRVFSFNYLGGFTQVDMKTNFIGLTLETTTTHKRLSSSDEIVSVNATSYTPQGRVEKQLHTIGELPTELIASYTYDQLGKLVSKNVGGPDDTGATGLQKVDYNYNIRGWLTGINNIGTLEVSGDPDDLFAFGLQYDTPEGTATPLYNGNISETYWRSDADNIKRKYAYQYDALNRMTSAVYEKPEQNISGAYNEMVKYSKNGNITWLLRTGDMDDELVHPEIDELNYAYDENSNRLLNVEDDSLNPSGFKDDANTGQNPPEDYEYDSLGNLVKDENKNITQITYNHLNLPVNILFSNGNTIAYLYDAAGGKLKKTVTDAIETTIEATDYVDGYHYIGGELRYLPHAEGYVNVYNRDDETFFNYVYNYTDHLGNIRVSWAKDPQENVLKILQENNYYPYGLRHRNYNFEEKDFEDLETTPGEVIIQQISDEHSFAYQQKYNGKEWQQEFGLNVTAMDFRQYDNALGRFNSIDPLSEFYEDTSPFAFCLNNPVFFADPTGLCPECPDPNKAKEGQHFVSAGGATYTFTDGQWTQEGGELSEIVLVGKKKEKKEDQEGQETDSVGQPGEYESMIPVWGYGRAAIDHFQNGNYWRGTFYGALAISDVFLMRSIVTGLVQGGLKLAGSSSWRATRSYYLKNGFARPNQPLHHWFFQQGGKIGKHVPNVIKNQMWNLKSFSTASMHMRAGHGLNYAGQKGFGTLGQLFYGTPSWVKTIVSSYGGRFIGDEYLDTDYEENNEN